MFALVFYTAVITTQLGVECGILQLPTSHKYENCSETASFLCENNLCIPNFKICDGNNDCVSGLDEKNCATICPEPYWFRCKSNKCISSSFVCDEENDCGDFSDEIDCKHDSQVLPVPVPTNCSKNEWQCSDRLCILLEWVCNGEEDCLDGSDEHVGCTERTSCDGFKCADGECIPSKWKCDGLNDCKDKSDEQHCDLALMPQKCKTDEGQILCNDTCISLTQVCTETTYCTHVANKTALCISAKDTCKTRKCSHGCTTTPLGSICTCPPGYGTDDVANCTDIDECKMYGICDQKCINTPGNYTCYCDRGYTLQNDGRTCKVNGGEGVLIFSSKTEIRGYYLQSELYFPIAKNLKHSIGVTYDGNHVYWTEIFAENESIIKALEDGTHKEVIVTSGIGTPEDLAIDWITRNVYFTDAEMRHIGVCTNDGVYCTVLINHDINKPRSIVLNPLDGEMYWTDWGKRPEIARSRMDGSEDISFVSNQIFWPNGLALDRPNQRLYWTDAKLMTLESISLDGSDRRVILQGIVKHPYSLDVFENRIYWSDWESKTIESCDKFTGKDHHILIKQKLNYVYGVHVYHPVLQTRSINPCDVAFCSHICLLSGESYTCACPENTVLGTDQRTCKRTAKEQLLIIGTNKMLWKVQFQELGKHSLSMLPVALQNITALAFNSLNNSIFLSDFSSRSIIVMDLHTQSISDLVNDNSIDHITAMDFDNLGNNLYWCDSGRNVIEVLNLNTYSRSVLLNDMFEETPTSIAVVPHEGVMFVAFQTPKLTSHIDRFYTTGNNRTHVIEKRLIGPVYLVYDFQLDRIFWTDVGTDIIESTSIDGGDRHTFRSLQNSAVAIASVNKNIFWANQHIQAINWAVKANDDEDRNKRLSLDMPKYLKIKYLVSITPQEVKTHACHQNNGNCSHICIAAVDSAICACPLGMKLQSNKKICVKPNNCDLTEYFCKDSRLCIPREMRCNNRTECSFGEDEKDCKKSTPCKDGYFQCKNTDCIKKALLCDMHYDCLDKSDEENCHYDKTCPKNYFQCNDGSCIEEHAVCDGYHNCKDGSDEADCKNASCNSAQFRCSTNMCIPKHWECDQELDCPDGSDEHNNCGYASCPSPQFLCTNGLCIDNILKCNKIDDCGDFSDERTCNKSHVSTCGPHEFMCYKNGSSCIPLSARCNGTSECPHHEDEEGCTDCQIDQFECNNKKCIPTQWLCDHVNDCGDESDEDKYFCLHEQHSIIQNTSYSCENEFRCKNGQCIDKTLVCNMIENCEDGSDEYGACSSSCLRDTNPCAQACIKSPTGPQCECGTGFKLRGDGRTCIDIKECLVEPPVCSQFCTEVLGSYKCSCYNEYVLRSDQISCKSIGEPMSLIFATSDEIYQFSQTNNTLKMLFSQKNLQITHIDVSIEKGYIYFSTENSGTLHRISLRKQVWEYINVTGQPQLIAVDWISENIYYVDNSFIQKSIRVCSFQQEYCAKILNIDIYSNVSALTVDAANEYLFYSTSKWQIFSYYGSVIYKCKLDGSSLEQIFHTSDSYITGLTYNLYKKMLYYVDYNNGAVYKVQYDGKDLTKIITNLTKPKTLTTFEDHLYFYIPNSYMTQCPLFKNYEACKSYKLNARFDEIFVIYHSSRQPSTRNVCQDQLCKQLCVREGDSAQCLCSFDKVNAKHECQNKKVTTVHFSNIKLKDSLKGNEISRNGKSYASFTIAITSVSIIAAVLCIYCYIRKKHSGNFNISMRFQNPVYGYLQNSSQEVILRPGQHEYYNPMEICSEKTQTVVNTSDRIIL